MRRFSTAHDSEAGPVGQPNCKSNNYFNNTNIASYPAQSRTTIDADRFAEACTLTYAHEHKYIGDR